MKLKIKVRKLSDNISLPKIIDKGEWIDLSNSEAVTMDAPYANTLHRNKDKYYRDLAFHFNLIPLGIAMKLPKGFEAIVAPRSSTFSKYKILQANSLGIIDSSYSGNEDEWKFPAIAFEDVAIDSNTRICQFRIQLSQKATVWQKLKWLLSSGIKIVEVDNLDDNNRGGFGSTGTN